MDWIRGILKQCIKSFYTGINFSISICQQQEEHTIKSDDYKVQHWLLKIIDTRSQEKHQNQADAK
jgi:hypothetical protein